MGQNQKNGGGGQAVATKAGKMAYDSFFELYAEIVRAGGGRRCPSILAGLAGEARGQYFAPLGFIPGPAVILSFGKESVRLVEATPDVWLGANTKDPKVCLEKIQDPLDEWTDLVEGLGREPSPWNMGFAKQLLAGNVPPRYLVMAMPRFRYRPGDRELPFGVVLVPTEDKDEMEVLRVYNPDNIPGAPAEGKTISLAELCEDQGPAQKILKTWAGMESNYSLRYHRDGNPRQPQAD